MLFHEDLLLEVDTVAHFHEFVGVARVAVLASELATSIRIDRPGEGHASAGTAVQQGADGEGEVLNLVSLAERFALGGETGNADEFRFGVGKQGKGSHDYIRFLFATKFNV